MIAALLLSRARMLRRDLVSPPAGRSWSRHPLVALTLTAVLAMLIHAGLLRVFAALDASGNAAARTGMLAVALTGALLALLAFDVDDVVRTLLLDPDLELLRRAPRPAAALLVIKALDAAPRTLMPLLVLAVPAIAVFLAGTESPARGALAAGLALFLLWCMALAAGVALSLLLLRVVPARRAREALGLVSTVVFMLLWVLGTMVAPRLLESGSGPGGALLPLLESAARGSHPAAAAARAIAAAADRDAGGAIRAGLPLLALAALALVLAGTAGRFALGRALERIAGPAALTRDRAAPRGVRSPAWRAEGAVRAIVRRDARMLRRSWTILGDLAVSSVMWGLLPLVGLARAPLDWPMLARFAVLTLTIGLGYEIGARSIPFERRAGYWLRVAPVSPWKFCLAKLIGAGLLGVPVVGFLGGVLAVASGIGPLATARLAAVTLGALVFSQATGIWAGLAFGDPEWVNPRAMLRLGGRLVAAVLVLAQLAAWGAAVTWLGSTRQPTYLWALAGIAGGFLAILPAWAAVRRIARTDSRH